MITSFRDEYHFLSNFYPCRIEYDGIVYPSTEHAYQAAKTLDRQERIHISGLSTPGDAKRYGRRVDIRLDWDRVKRSVMLELVLKKFSVEPLKSKLLSTGSIQLIEGNTWGDRYWGAVLSNGMWTGQNHLGKILMLVREQVK